MTFKDISKSPAGSTNGRFHALGFTKQWEKTNVAIWSRGDELYRTVGLNEANELLDKLESNTGSVN